MKDTEMKGLDDKDLENVSGGMNTDVVDQQALRVQTNPGENDLLSGAPVRADKDRRYGGIHVWH